MASRQIMFRGKLSTVGVCKCGRRLIITTSKPPKGAFESFHEVPMCEAYLAIVGDDEGTVCEVTDSELRGLV